MSQQLGSVVIALRAVDECSSVMDKVRSSTSLLASTFQSMGGAMGSVGNIMQGLAVGGPVGALTAAVGETAKGLQDCIKEATASEAVWASLAAAVTRSGTAWDSVSAATHNALLEMQKTTTYSDEQLAAALERLMTFGLSYDQAMQALGKSIDLAAAKHMDLTSAATLVGKAMDGNTAILKRYGVDIATSKDAAAALKDAHDAAAVAIKAMGTSVDAWVTSVTAAISADSTFESGLAGAKDKAQYLIDQFKQGNIDLPQFTQAMTSLGVPLDEAKMKGGTAAEVLTKLNEQFGGAAQAAASTYAGIQERLKNATQEVGEKIGTIFLPALASLTEGMLPVVDGLGKGVDAISAWLTEVSKMPEVQGIMTALGDAFGGFMKYLEDLWGFITAQFSPALQELMSAFKDLWDALSPIGDALKELLSIFGDTGNIDLLKLVIMGIVIQIRAVAEVIKEVAPYIKGFAQAFKEAADFITPILTQIVGGIRIFIDAMKTLFQNFYNWLIGASLWRDMWQAILTLTTQMVTTLLGNLTAQLFQPMQTAFATAVQTVENLWSTAWQAIQTACQTAMSLIQSTIQIAMTAIQTTITVAWQVIQGDWQGALASIQNALTQWGGVATGIMNGIMGQLQGAVQNGVAVMQGAFAGLVSSAQNALAEAQRLFQQAQQAIASTTQQIVQATNPATQTITNAFDTAYNAIVGGAQDLWQQLVGGSIWPDTMDTMQSITDQTMSNIQSRVSSGFKSVVSEAQSSFNELQRLKDQAVAFMASYTGGGNVSAAFLASQQAAARAAQAATWKAPNVPAGAGTIPAGTSQLGALEYVKAWEEAPGNQSAFWVPEKTMNLTGGDLASYAQKLADAIQASRMTNATLPVSIVIDGVTVSRVVEKRLVSQYQMAGGY